MDSADEQQPLLRPIVEGIEADPQHHEVILDFAAGDPENPREWAAPYHWSIVLLLASMAFTVYVNWSTFLFERKRSPSTNVPPSGRLRALASCR
jgi:hypothetical protein